MKFTCLTIWTTLLPLLVGGCIEEKDECDQGHVNSGNLCVDFGVGPALPSPSSPSTTPESSDAGSLLVDASSGTGNPAPESNEVDPHSGFGDPCVPDPGQPMVGFSQSADCKGGANTCAVVPGQPGGCTAIDCMTDESICPPDWSCFDTASVFPGEPSACTPPM